MGNSWFQFQQFTIRQGRAAMKVCTDSCLFGAYVPSGAYSKILDVGAGTGLLGLMLAQRCPDSEIHFLESDPGTFLDLKLNVEQSPWNERCHIHHCRVEDWTENNSYGKFDFVICNPPFFVNHLQSPQKSRNQSLHLDIGKWEIWVESLSRVLAPAGQLWLLLPGKGSEELLYAFHHQSMVINEKIDILQSSKAFRTIACLSFSNNKSVKKAQLEMRNADGSLSDWALELVKDYYLLAPTPS